MGWESRFKGVLVLVAVAGAGVWGYRYWESHKHDLPSLELDEIQGRDAGWVDLIRGQAYGAAAVGMEFAPLKEKSRFILGTTFRVPGGTFVQLQTFGNYLIGMDGDGEFILEKARVSAEKNKHTLHWYVRKGTLRIKPNSYDPGKHLIEVRTAIARVQGDEAEMGVRINEGGGGQVWLMSGKAEIFWNDGRRKELKERGMDYL